MGKPKSSAKPLCHACNRPFDPRSPGATLTMGPTCAKRGVYESSSQTQLSFDGALADEHLRPAPPKKVRLSPRRTLPPHLHDRYVLAKLAFDELYREFCGNGSLLTGDTAAAQVSELRKERCEEHSLRDLLLHWLEPEHDWTLLIDRDEDVIYLSRVINGVRTCLTLAPLNTASAKQNLELIFAFTRSIRAHRELEDGVQLSLDLSGESVVRSNEV